MRGPLPQQEFDWIFSRVPRLTVEVVIATPDHGVLLQRRDREPCKGLWALPGGTVRFGEPVIDAVKRVAIDELGVRVSVGELLGYIEYPSHYNNGLDSPVGLAFSATNIEGPTPTAELRMVHSAPGQHARRAAIVPCTLRRRGLGGRQPRLIDALTDPSARVGTLLIYIEVRRFGIPAILAMSSDGSSPKSR